MSFLSRIVGFLSGGLALVAAAMPATAKPTETAGLEYVRNLKDIGADSQVIVDSRAAGRCGEQSLGGARCLPADDFLGPHRRLAQFVDIAWLLGTAGLRGDEAVLVVGDDAARRDFVAGVLHVMGQRRVRVLATPVSKIIAAKSLSVGPGTARAITRERVFTAPARSGAAVFAGELARRTAGAAPVILDGRNEAEYWGQAVRASRGGHLPGADHLAAPALRAALARGERPGPAPTRGRVVVYGHDALEGFAFYTLVRAGLGLDAAVYPGGWAEWAQSGRAADAVTHPDRHLDRHSGRQRDNAAAAERAAGLEKWIAPGLAGAAVFALAMFGLGIAVGRGRTA